MYPDEEKWKKRENENLLLFAPCLPSFNLPP
jgi:hypothetical protein